MWGTQMCPSTCGCWKLSYCACGTLSWSELHAIHSWNGRGWLLLLPVARTGTFYIAAGITLAQRAIGRVDGRLGLVRKAGHSALAEELSQHKADGLKHGCVGTDDEEAAVACMSKLHGQLIYS